MIETENMAKIPQRRRRTKPRTERAITRAAEKRIRKLIENPPPGSAIAKAKEFGVDLYSVLENLKLTPAERFRRAAEETDLVRYVRKRVDGARS